MQVQWIFTGGAIDTPTGIINGGVLAVSHDGTIAYAGLKDGLKGQDGKHIDLHGKLLVPGFIDLHVHGGMRGDFMDGTEEAFRAAAKNCLSGGATTIYPTTVCASDDALFLRTKSRMNSRMTCAAGRSRT